MLLLDAFEQKALSGVGLWNYDTEEGFMVKEQPVTVKRGIRVKE